MKNGSLVQFMRVGVFAAMLPLSSCSSRKAVSAFPSGERGKEVEKKKGCGRGMRNGAMQHYAVRRFGSSFG